MSNYIKIDDRNKEITLQLSVLVFQQGDYYVSYCPSLELSSYGDSIEEAKTGFDDVMKIYLEECQKKGTLHADLLAHGWQLNIDNDKEAAPPQMVELNIPAGVLKQQFNESWRVPAEC